MSPPRRPTGRVTAPEQREPPAPPPARTALFAPPARRPDAPPGDALSPAAWFALQESRGVDDRVLLGSGHLAQIVVFDAHFRWSDVPVVGGTMPPGMDLGLDGFALVCTPSGNGLLPDLSLAGKPFFLPPLLVGGEGAGPTAAATAPSGIPACWRRVDVDLGPLAVHRLGVGFHDRKLWLLLDASLRLGPVGLSVLGLGLGIPLDRLLAGEWATPSLHLDGLGIEVTHASGTRVSGALLRQTTDNGDRYCGALTIQYQKVVLSALGLFQQLPGQSPMLFAYGALSRPFGGPPFFYVTGLAVGFGVNTAFTLPDVARAHEFPLVREASAGPVARAPDIGEVLRIANDLQSYQRAAPGKTVLALGVRGTSFGIVNSTLLLLATMGDGLMVDFIGQSVLRLPPQPGPRPIADIGINWRGAWAPGSDKIEIRGQIRDGSWAFHSRFALTGQMAFIAWTQGPNAGDFVFTVGGYAPSFAPPAHYPSVQRLQLGWTEHLSESARLEVKGEGYFAITPRELMAGGGLRCSLFWGPVEAWFEVGADFVLSWHPFRYWMHMSIEIGASFPFFGERVRLRVGADLELWGPDLGGRVTFGVGPFKVSVGFGAGNETCAYLTWGAFKAGFLQNNPLSLRSVGGLDAEMEVAGERVWVINPAAFGVEIASAVPAGEVKIDERSFSQSTFGVRPMNLKSMTSKLTVEVVTAGNVRIPCDVVALKRNMPAALWGEPSEGRAGPTLIKDMLVGVSLASLGGARSPGTKAIVVEVEPEEINWDVCQPREAQGPAIAKEPLKDYSMAATPGRAAEDDFAALWVADTVAAGRESLLRELLDLPADDLAPRTVLTRAWIDELQQTPSLWVWRT